MVHYAYHYHAIFQAEPGATTHLDGILTCKTPIDSIDRYAEIKKSIADELAPGTADRLAICSLTLLHELHNLNSPADPTE